MAIINGTEDNDTLTGATPSATPDTINGLGGNDDLTAGAGDTLNGGAGDDVMRAALSGRTGAHGGDGVDTLVVDYSAFSYSVLTDLRANGSGVITNQYGHQTDFTGIERFEITGGFGSDTITAEFQPARIRSGDGGDRVNTGAMAPDADGGAGLDTWGANFSLQSQAITLDMGQAGPISIAGGTIQNFEQLDLTTGSGDDVITGRISPSVRQDNVIRTGAGHDRITVGGQGMNTIDGGLGDDLLTIDYSQLTTVVTNTGTYASRGLLALGSTASVDFQGIERLDIRSGSAADDFTGRDGADTLSGGAGNDRIDGRNGDDTIDGGAGADTLTGGMGRDTVAFDSATTGVTASLLAGGLTGTGDAAGDTYTGFENLRGSGFNDTLEGDAGDNVLHGLAGDDGLYGQGGVDLLAGFTGDDFLDGGAGADIMIGSAGNDTFVVDDAGDKVDEIVGQGVDTVRTTLASYELSGALENLVGTASTGQELRGNDGANVITGGSGDDLLNGGYGADTLDGGAGTDKAVFRGELSAYTAQLQEDGSIRLAGPVGTDGTDVIRNVELFQFDNGVFTRQELLNRAPTLTQPLTDVTAAEDAAFTAPLPVGAFADADGDVLTYTATLADGSALPTWLTLDRASGALSGTPTNGEVGALEIRVTATDPLGKSASDVFTLTVANVNDAPIVAAPLSDLTTAEDAPFSHQLPTAAFADVDAGDVLTYAAARADGSALPAWLSFDPVTRTFSGTPANGDVGTLELRVTATDAAGAQAADVFTLSVSNVNDAPVLRTAIADRTTAEDASFSYQLPADTFTDVDAGEPLTYAATRADGSALPSWLSFDPATRTFSGTPANRDVGPLDVRVTATDAAGAQALDVFTLAIANTNDAPTLAQPLADLVIAEDAPFSFQAPANTFADMDAGDALSFVATRADGSALPAWLSFNAATQTFSGTPLNGDVGAFDVRLTATDAAGATVSDVFRLTVTDVDNDGGPSDPPMNVIDGTARSDVLTGGHGRDQINGLDGADILRGRDGDDVLEGGDGADLLFGDSGSDILDGGLKSDVLDGGQGDDQLFGGEGSDTLRGGSGRDRLAGGAGDDVLGGGAGDDIFVFERGGGADVVLDFRASPGGRDVIDLTAFTTLDGFDDLVIGRNALGQAVLQLDGASVTLAGVSPGQLTASDFLFGQGGPAPIEADAFLV